MEKIKVGVAGACGRMGSRIIKAVNEQEDMKLVCAIEASKSIHKGKDAGEVIGIGKTGVRISTSDELDEVLKRVKPDVLVDFTVAEAVVETARTAAKNKVNLVIGTTGFTLEQRKEMEDAIRKDEVAAVISPNMATGVNIFFKEAERIAKLLGEEYDVEIIEAHHRFKKDSPSGTALRVGELIAEATGGDIGTKGVFGRRRGVIGERKKGEIGFHAIRAGDIVGEHTVLFAGNGERLEITHRAHGRRAFVSGALKAIRFLYEKGEKGTIYSTWDVLGIK